METLFLSAFGLSIAFAAQPGVITFESIRRGIANGARAALWLEFGSLVGDATWAIIALTSAAFLFQNRVVAFLLSFFGCYLLLRFAWDAWKASHKQVAATGPAKAERGNFAAGVVLSLSNPGNLTFWLGISGTVISLRFPEPGAATSGNLLQRLHDRAGLLGIFHVTVNWLGQPFLGAAHFSLD
ncbi:MAG: LysE family transporter [Anaerolineae bacterium]